MDTLTLYFQQFVGTQSKDFLGDFHLLKYLINNDIYSFSLVRKTIRNYVPFCIC